jgi:hypothetical protein
MIDIKLFALVFLTVRNYLTSLNEILYAANIINNEEPTLKELQSSFGWLQTQEFVRKNGKMYLLTETGIALRNSVSQRNTESAWIVITERFSQLPKIDFQPDEITEKEFVAAKRINKKQLKEIIQKMINE